MTRREALWISLGSVGLLRAQRPDAETAITNVTVIDGAGSVLRGQTVVTRGDRTVAVREFRNVQIPVGALRIDGSNRFLIPGLCDAHAHLSYFKWSALPVLLANGVTTIRDMGGRLDELDEWRTETDTGVRHGPRIFRAGPILNGKPFNEFQVAVKNADEARGAVRTLRQSGVDFIKVHAAISRDAYYGVQGECRELHLPYVGHMPRAITPAEASDAGQRTLEHVGAFADRFESEGVAADAIASRLATFRHEDASALFARFARNKTWFTPTLITSKAAIHLGDHKPDPRDKYVPASCKKITEELLKRPSYQAFLRPDSVARQEQQFSELIPLVNVMHKEGVRLLAGTDFAASILYPGFSLHDELELLVSAGLSARGALEAATANPAEVLGHTDLGVIKAGNRADMVLLDANPMEAIGHTRRIRGVMSRGKWFDRAALNGLLAQAEAEARTS